MPIRNDTSFPVIADYSYGFLGSGRKKFIQPDETAQVLGPPLGKIEGRDYYHIFMGLIVCRETPINSGSDFYVTEGHPIHFKSERGQITIWHCASGKEAENCGSCQLDCDWNQK